MRSKSIPVPVTKTKIKVRTIKAAPPKESVDSMLVHFVHSKDISKTLADTMQMWKELDNKWLTSMEAELELDSKGMKIEGGVQLNAIRALVFMDYIMEKKGGYQDVWVTRYKLSKQGLKAVGMKEEEEAPTVKEPKAAKVKVSPPEKTATTTKAVVSTDCGRCGGSGVDDNVDICKWCKGSGEVAGKVKVQQTQLTRKHTVRRK